MSFHSLCPKESWPMLKTDPKSNSSVCVFACGGGEMVSKEIKLDRSNSKSWAEMDENKFLEALGI